MIRLATIPGRLALAILAGVLLFLAFPPVGLWWLAPFGIALFTFVTGTTARYRSGFGYGLLAGVVFFGLLLGWIAVLGSDAWIALSIYCALWLAVQGMGNRLVMRLPFWPLAIAGLWILQEALRGRIPWGGFPWGRMAFSQADSSLLGLASLGGAPLLTFAVALAGGCLLWLVLAVTPSLRSVEAVDAVRLPRSLSGIRTIGGLVAIAVVAALPLAIPRPTDGQADQGPATAMVAVVQGSVPTSGLDAMAQRQAVLDNHVTETERLAADVRAGRTAQPQLVIWPENSVDVDPINNAGAAARITAAADAIGVPILIGAVTFNPTQPNTLWNVGIVWQPGTGPGEFYVKRHPVPFGEYLPGRSLLLRFISRFERIPYDFAPGQDPGVLQVGPARLGDVICFEIAYDAEVADTVRAGARVLTAQTNNATFADSGFGGTAQPQQQAAMSQIRAVEHGRSVLIAATSGITAIVDAAGQVQQQAPMYASTYLTSEVPLRDTLTISDRFGWTFEWVVVALITAWLVLAVIRVRRGEVAVHDGDVSSSKVPAGR